MVIGLGYLCILGIVILDVTMCCVGMVEDFVAMWVIFGNLCY